MAKLIEPRTLPGFRDFLPEDMAVRKRVISILTAVFEKYGFSPMENPTLEYQDILLGKSGAEAEKLMYLFKDPGQRDVGMRYELTISTARVLAQYPNLVKPFKRYQIQPVWRADKPQKGRYREITQCDIDTFGSNSPLADAEIIAVIYEGLRGLGFKEFTIRINSRQILFAMMAKADVPQDKYLTTIQSIDKLDKKSQEEVERELEEKGFSKETVKSIFDNIKNVKPDQNLTEIFDAVQALGVPREYYKFEPFLSRGLDYYTGIVFETSVTEPKIGSVTGGGRYDRLIGKFIGQDIAATGTSFGIDRICDVITELNLWPNLSKTPTTALVTIFSPELLAKSLELTEVLRQKNINTEVYLDATAKLDKQLKYADAKGIPFAVIIGPDEVEKKLVTVKNLRSKTQTTTTPADALKLISEKT
ncbi:histidine--tRNA ligase [Patescibacteria group bacterium]|nr:histidine--tRNA ligase [Patescibacteria group bacterium]